MIPIIVWFGFGILIFIVGFRQLRLRRHILAIPTSKTRSVAMGVVELSGRARIHSPLLDPIYSQPCAYYNVEVKEKRGSGKNSHWVTIYKKTSESTMFLIEDSTGCAFVVPKDAELHFQNRISKYSSSIGRVFSGSDPISQFLSHVGSGLRSLHLIAHILRQGDPLFVLGHVGMAISSTGTKGPLPIRDVARELKNNPEKMKLLDLNKDGHVDAHEWEEGLQIATSTQLSSSEQKIPVIQKGGDEIFVLADSEKNLLSKFSWSSWLAISMGCGIMLFTALQLLRF